MTAPTSTSPNVGNLQVGKGIVSFKKDGDSVYRDLGNVTSIAVTPSADVLEHYSSRTGTKKRDLIVTVLQKAQVKMVMEEITAENLALMVYGTVDEHAVGGPAVEIFGTTTVKGALKFVGTNDLGPKVTLNLWNVSWIPSGTLEMISDQFNNMEVTGDVLAADSGPNVGKFGNFSFTNATPS